MESLIQREKTNTCVGATDVFFAPDDTAITKLFNFRFRSREPNPTNQRHFFSRAIWGIAAGLCSGHRQNYVLFHIIEDSATLVTMERCWMRSNVSINTFTRIWEQQQSLTFDRPKTNEKKKSTPGANHTRFVFAFGVSNDADKSFNLLCSPCLFRALSFSVSPLPLSLSLSRWAFAVANCFLSSLHSNRTREIT